MRVVRSCSSPCLVAAARSLCSCPAAARWRSTPSTQENSSRCSGVTTITWTAASSTQTIRWNTKVPGSDDMPVFQQHFLCSSFYLPPFFCLFFPVKYHFLDVCAQNLPDSPFLFDVIDIIRYKTMRCVRALESFCSVTYKTPVVVVVFSRLDDNIFRNHWNRLTLVLR